MDPQAALKPDPLLLPYLHAKAPADAERHLKDLLDRQAEPIIQAILRRKLRVSLSQPGGRAQSREQQDAEDVHGEAVVQLLTRLRSMKSEAEGGAIGDFRAYAAVTTYRACDAYLRRKYPQRWSLLNRLRYLLENRTGQSGFGLWQDERGSWLGGFAAWQSEQRPPASAGRCERLLRDPQAFAQRALPNEDVRRMNPAALLAALFHEAGGPIELDDLVRVVAELWEVKDSTPVEESGGPDEPREPAWERAADPAADIGAQVEQRDYLRRLWEEIRQLPARQRAALLLNLRDHQGRGILALLPLAGIATVRQIAALLEIPAPEFAALWNDLPLEDAAIARRMSLTRQQVINLRKVARERLARRMKAPPE
jgi:hypothetical protein